MNRSGVAPLYLPAMLRITLQAGERKNAGKKALETALIERCYNGKWNYLATPTIIP